MPSESALQFEGSNLSWCISFIQEVNVCGLHESGFYICSNECVLLAFGTRKNNGRVMSVNYFSSYGIYYRELRTDVLFFENYLLAIRILILVLSVHIFE